jgi:hypothetical protein
MRLIAELTMPNVGSWNGTWTGRDRKYTKVFSTSASKKSEKHIGNYYYNFGDGWGANVEIRYAEPRERVSNLFAGYEWMINSIKLYGDILSTKQIKERNETETK